MPKEEVGVHNMGEVGGSMVNGRAGGGNVDPGTSRRRERPGAAEQAGAAHGEVRGSEIG